MCKNKFYKRRFFILPLIVVGLFVASAVVMLLWNLVIPTIFTSLLPISLWQAMGLFVLSHILFGRVHGGHRHKDYGFHFNHMAYREKFMNMTDEEKEQFKDNMKKRCCN
jgi:hypothetical protein